MRTRGRHVAQPPVCHRDLSLHSSEEVKKPGCFPGGILESAGDSQLPQLSLPPSPLTFTVSVDEFSVLSLESSGNPASSGPADGLRLDSERPSHHTL